ncbi:hypothetical protein LDENG_00101690, partial [Lucifuga dentata]
FGAGTKLTVLEPGCPVTPPAAVQIFKPSKKECQKHNAKKTLVCVVSGFYPDHVTVSWQVDGIEETNGVATDTRAIRKGKVYSLTSRLRVSAKTWFKAATEFTCTAHFFNQNQTEDYKSDPVYSEKGAETGMTKTEYTKTSQNAKLIYIVLIVKSCIYAVFIIYWVWKIKDSYGKKS